MTFDGKYVLTFAYLRIKNLYDRCKRCDSPVGEWMCRVTLTRSDLIHAKDFSALVNLIESKCETALQMLTYSVDHAERTGRCTNGVCGTTVEAAIEGDLF